MKKLLKPSIENLKLVGEILYNFTGAEYYLYLVQNYYQSRAMCGTYRGFFFDFYYDNLKQLKQHIADGNVFKYPLLNFGNLTLKPYIYNTL